jgi:hypothetical protein
MPLPRGLLLSAVLWVAACFLVTIGTQAPIQPTTGAYTPVVRTMIALLAVGACIGWPVARFGSARGAWGPARALLDTLTVLTVFHAVFWPAFLMSAGVALPKRIYSHGFLFNKGLDKFVESTNYSVRELYILFARFKALCSLSSTPTGVDREAFRLGVPMLSVEDDLFVDRVFEVLDEDGFPQREV